MNRRRVQAILVGAVASVAVAGGVAPSASAQTLQRQLVCDGAEPNALTANLPLVASGCENGAYDPATETYAPYDPATDDNGLLGLNKTLGRDFFGL